MKISVQLLFLTSIYQCFGLLHFNLCKLHRPSMPPLYNTIVTTDPLPDGFKIDSKVLTRPPKPKQPISVSNISHLKELIYQGYRVEDLDVRGDTSRNSSDIHPVVRALHRRKEMKVRKKNTVKSRLYVNFVVECSTLLKFLVVCTQIFLCCKSSITV